MVPAPENTVTGGAKTVAVDANPAARPVHTGTEVYARELARRLPSAAPSLRFLMYASRPGDVAGLDFTVLPGRRLWSQGRLAAHLWRSRPDLFFAPSHVVPFLAPGPALTVVHDLAFERWPGAYSAGARAYLRLTTRWAERRCPRLVAVSRATADDLAELHGVDPRRVVVVPNGGGEPPASQPGPKAARERAAALGVDGPFVLQVGRLEPRKNQITALSAVERLPDLLLACAGPETDGEVARWLRASPRCRVLGRVSDQDLEALYAAAEALVVPSLYEGFGLPVLEGLRRGVPVVASPVPALREVGGDAAVYAEDAGDPEALAAALRAALASSGRRRELGREWAARFTWDRTAAGVADVIRELLA